MLWNSYRWKVLLRLHTCARKPAGTAATAQCAAASASVRDAASAAANTAFSATTSLACIDSSSDDEWANSFHSEESGPYDVGLVNCLLPCLVLFLSASSVRSVDRAGPYAASDRSQRCSMRRARSSSTPAPRRAAVEVLPRQPQRRRRVPARASTRASPGNPAPRSGELIYILAAGRCFSATVTMRRRRRAPPTQPGAKTAEST